MMNHLVHQVDSGHEQQRHDHRQVKSTDPHTIDCSSNGFLVPRFQEEMKKVASVDVPMQRSNAVFRVLHALRSCVLHPILFLEGLLTQKLYSRMWKDHDHKPQLKASQEPQLRIQLSQKPLDKIIYELEGIRNWRPQVFDLDTEDSAKRMASLCAVASNLSYEQEEDDIEDVVNGTWNMCFIKFFDCWDEYKTTKCTQAFMFTDKKENAKAVVIVFRGTEMKVADWGTDIDLAMSPMKGMDPEIQVHEGFRKALGIPTESSGKAAAAPPPPSHFAYDAISAKLREVLLANPEAKVFVTGHSLGGALAALFTAFLMHEIDGIQSKLKGVFTFGQPRVGNASFAQYMQERLCSDNNNKNARKYFRVVFSNDVVPRVPPDNTLFKFKHISPCVYYESSENCEIMEEEPHKNLLSDILMAHIAAIKKLFQSLRHRKEEKEVTDRLKEIFTPAACDHSCLGYIDALKRAPSVFLKTSHLMT